MSWGTFDQKHSLQSFGIVVFKHGEDLWGGTEGWRNGQNWWTDDGSGNKPPRKYLWLVSRRASVRVPRSRRSVWRLRCSSPAERRWQHVTRRTGMTEGTREQEVHPNLLRLPLTLPPEHLRVLDLRLHEVLLARWHQQTFGVQRTDHVVPDGTALSVVPAHPSGHVLLDYLMGKKNWVLQIPPTKEKTASWSTRTSGGLQSEMMLSTFILILNSRCCGDEKETQKNIDKKRLSYTSNASPSWSWLLLLAR